MTELTAPGLGRAADQWRLLLAFHVGRAGHAAISQQLLAPLLSSPDLPVQGTARAILYAVGGPAADIRLQTLILEAELTELSGSASDDDRLRIHHALAANYAALSNYQQAVTHAQHELQIRTEIQGPDHPDTLAIRADLAYWTGHAGNLRGALSQFEELLPDVERILGPNTPHAVSIRNNLAAWTGYAGDPSGALRLFEEKSCCLTWSGSSVSATAIL